MVQGAIENVVGQLGAVARPLRGQVAHVLEDGLEHVARLVGQLVFVHQFPQQRLLEGFARVPPQLLVGHVLAPGRRQRLTLALRLLRD